ncbi:uncharacterized protein [Rutidosis leptorrhynchoides]|uniref:uncharacterized protein n=1 Tax=Rutidosis leptorrhynchoides TaxID=125765 RepID=UPI003A994B5E
MSGLEVNYQKSTLYGVSVEGVETETLARSFKCNVGSFPFTYLGIPVGGKMNKIESWEPVNNKFEKRLSDWKARSMSFGGRFLVKSVLNSLSLYFFSLFRAPQSVLKKLESGDVPFFWSGSEKKHIFLGFKSETDSLWVKVISSIYGVKGGLGDDTHGNSCSFKTVWANVIASGNLIDSHGVTFKNSFAKKIGDGGATFFLERQLAR